MVVLAKKTDFPSNIVWWQIRTTSYRFISPVAERAPNETNARGAPMKFVKFGRTGLTVSRVCMGTATFGKQTEENTAQQILDRSPTLASTSLILPTPIQ